MNWLRGLFGAEKEPSGTILLEVEPATVHEWLHQGKCILVDVREHAEFRSEHIPGSRLAPLSQLEHSVPPAPDGTKLVYLCRSGARTRAHAGRLARCGPLDAYIMRGGIGAWKASGFPTRRN